MLLHEKIREIADDYAEFTGKEAGWEACLSIEEYGQLRELALKELQIPSAAVKSVKEIHKHTTVEQDVSMRPQCVKEKPCEISPNNVISIIEPGIKSKKTKEAMELEILLGLKDD